MENTLFKYIPIENDDQIRMPILINMVLAWLLFSVQITPILSRNTPNILKLALLLAWFLSTTLEKGGPLPTIKDKIIVYCSLFWLIEVIWRVVGFSGINPLVYLVRMSIFAIPLVSVYILRYYSFRAKQIFLLGMNLIVIANLISNVYLYIKYPKLFYVFGHTGFTIKSMTNVGDTSFVFVCVLFIITTLIRSINVRFSYRTLVNIMLMLLFSFHIVFQNNRATAFVIFVAMILSVFMVTTGRIKDNVKMKMFLRVVIGIVLFVTLSLPFLSFLSSFFSDAYMGSRLAILSSFLSGEYSLVDGSSANDSFSARIALMQGALGTIFDSLFNFIFGIGEFEYGTYNLRQLLNAGVSNHSELIDAFTYYGVFGGVVYILFFKSVVNYVLQYCYTDQIRRQCMVSLIIIFIYSMLNKFFSGDIMYMLILYFPLSMNIISMKCQNLVLLSNKSWIGKV